MPRVSWPMLFATILAILAGLWTGRHWPFTYPNPTAVEQTLPSYQHLSDAPHRENGNLDTELQVSRRAKRALPIVLPANAWQPLPPADLPLRASFALLKSRADEGDAPAACRLAAELQNCQRVMFATSQGQSSAGIDDLFRHCQGMSSEELGLEYAYLRQAALAGNLAAMEVYISGARLRVDLRRNADYLEVYSSEAARLAEVALMHGSVDALSSITFTASPTGGETMLGAALGWPYDEARWRDLSALQGLAFDFGDPSLSTLEARRKRLANYHKGEDHRVYAALEAKALKRFQMWFGGKAQNPFNSGLIGMLTEVGKIDFNPRCSGPYIADPMNQRRLDWSE